MEILVIDIQVKTAIKFLNKKDQNTYKILKRPNEASC